MTKDQLLERLKDVEWNDFEVKEASGGLPKSIWETVCAFSNTAGGWIILGVKEIKTDHGTDFTVNGVQNIEQLEQDIVTTLRSRKNSTHRYHAKPLNIASKIKTFLPSRYLCHPTVQ